jgi:hypothetical protein
MKTMYRYLTAAALVSALITSACDGALTDTEPRPGVLTVTFTTSHSDDGAVSLILRGKDIGKLESVSDDRQMFLVDGDASDGELRLALIGEGLSGTLIRFAVPDVNQIDAYKVELLEVADEANRLRENLRGYELVISGG